MKRADAITTVAELALRTLSHEFRTELKDPSGNVLAVGPISGLSGPIKTYLQVLVGGARQQGVLLVLRRSSTKDQVWEYCCQCGREDLGKPPRSHKGANDSTESKHERTTDTSKSCDCPFFLRVTLRIAYSKRSRKYQVTHHNDLHRGHFPFVHLPTVLQDQDKETLRGWRETYGFTMGTMLTLLRDQGVFATSSQVHQTSRGGKGRGEKALERCKVTEKRSGHCGGAGVGGREENEQGAMPTWLRPSHFFCSAEPSLPPTATDHHFPNTCTHNFFT